MIYLIVKNIEDSHEYYDVNRVNKLKDKLSVDTGPYLTKLISNLKRITIELNPKLMIRQSNIMLLEIAK